MPTPPRPPIRPGRTPAGHGRCPVCGSLFVCNTRGRPREYCGKECRDVALGIRRLQDALTALAETGKGTPAGLSMLRRTLWSAGNLVPVNRGISNSDLASKRRDK